MEINVILNKGHGKIEGNKDITLSLSEDLTLNFACLYPLKNASVAINGEQYRIDGNRFTIPQKHLTEEHLRVIVGLYKNNKVDRVFEVEPITLRKLDATYKGHTEFDELTARVQALEEKFAEQQKLINNLTDRISGTEMF